MCRSFQPHKTIAVQSALALQPEQHQQGGFKAPSEVQYAAPTKPSVTPIAVLERQLEEKIKRCSVNRRTPPKQKQQHHATCHPKQELTISEELSETKLSDREDHAWDALIRIMRRQLRDAPTKRASALPNRPKSISLRPTYANRLSSVQIAQAIQQSHDIRQMYLRRESAVKTNIAGLLRHPEHMSQECR